MYLIMNPPLCELNKIMQEIPNFPPQGHGRMIREYVYTSADCDCLYCLYHIGSEKNGGCSLEHCMCLQERIEAGAVMQSERWREAAVNISDAQFQRRLSQYFKESEAAMDFKNELHHITFEKTIRKWNRKNSRLMAALYLLTADRKLWNIVKRVVMHNEIYFNQVKLTGIHPNGYTLFCGAKDIYLDTRYLSVSDLADEDLITPNMFGLFCNAMSIRRFGLSAIYFNKGGRRENDTSGSQEQIRQSRVD